MHRCVGAKEDEMGMTAKKCWYKWTTSNSGEQRKELQADNVLAKGCKSNAEDVQEMLCCGHLNKPNLKWTRKRDKVLMLS